MSENCVTRPLYVLCANDVLKHSSDLKAKMGKYREAMKMLPGTTAIEMMDDMMRDLDHLCEDARDLWEDVE